MRQKGKQRKNPSGVCTFVGRAFSLFINDFPFRTGGINIRLITTEYTRWINIGYPGVALLLFAKKLGVCSYVVLLSNSVTYRDNVKCLQLSICFKPNDDNIISILLNTVFITPYFKVTLNKINVR